MICLVQNDFRVAPGLYAPFVAGGRGTLVRAFAGDPLPDPAGLGALIVLGGTMGADDDADYPYLRGVRALMSGALEREVPLLGICLGGQLLAQILGAAVTRQCRSEHGMHPVSLTAAGMADPLFAGFPPSFPAFQWHSDSFDLPPASTHLASTAGCPGQSFRYRQAVGLQFHPEVDRALVAAWSGTVDRDGRYLLDYLSGEERWAELGLRLGRNFLGSDRRLGAATAGVPAF